MSENNKDLLVYAAEYADKNVDLYDLLGVDALTQEADIRRAWRKRSLMYHPDKAGDKFDASKWELFERARDILSDLAARAVYDNAAKAKLLRKQERDAMDKERKKFADDLEARENAARDQRLGRQQQDREAMQKERDRLADLKRVRDEETRRQADAAQEMEDLAIARKRMKEKKDERTRRRLAKDAMKTAGKPSGPVNGVVLVPGDFVAHGQGDAKRKYWELVCDKLRAMQELRNLQSQAGTAQQVEEAERGVQEARRKIQHAETTYQAETQTV